MILWFKGERILVGIFCLLSLETVVLVWHSVVFVCIFVVVVLEVTVNFVLEVTVNLVY